MLAAILALVAVLAGCSSGSLAGTTTVTSTANGIPDGSGSGARGPDGSASSSAPSSTVVVPPVASVSARPALNSKGLSPSEPIVVTVNKGTFDDVTLKNPEGQLVDASVSDDGKTFTVDEVLGFGKTYTVTGTATGTDGKQVPITGTFTTVGTDAQVRNTVYPVDDAVVGVAAPVIVYFGVEPADKAAVQKHVTLTTTPGRQGAWAWIQHDDGRWALDYRTKDYWPAGTKVHVAAKLYGVELAGRLRRRGHHQRLHHRPQPGGHRRRQLARAGGAAGRRSRRHLPRLLRPRRGHRRPEPDHPLRHPRGERVHETKLMSNPRYGYTNSPEKWAVRISNNGEFIHANPASTGAQGSSNVTHGCVNLSLADAEAYFHSAIWGDPVEVTGTSVQPGPGRRRHLHLGDVLGRVAGSVGAVAGRRGPRFQSTARSVS